MSLYKNFAMALLSMAMVGQGKRLLDDAHEDCKKPLATFSVIPAAETEVQYLTLEAGDVATIQLDNKHFKKFDRPDGADKCHWMLDDAS
jgi:hypothetical protein